MTEDPITISESTLAVDAIEKMERNRKKSIAVMPVIDHSKNMLGLLRLHDLIQAGLAKRTI